MGKALKIAKEHSCSNDDDQENESDICFYEDGHFFYKENERCLIWSVETDEIGPRYFSFDKKTIFNFWTDYPDKLTKEQIEVFKREFPALAALKPLVK